MALWFFNHVTIQQSNNRPISYSAHPLSGLFRYAADQEIPVLIHKYPQMGNYVPVYNFLLMICSC